MSEDLSDLDFGATVRGFSAGQKLFDRYTLKEILGRGGMGMVWRAFDEQLERDVALKFLPELLVLDKAAMDELKREAKRSLELTHHYIVRIYDFEKDSRRSAANEIHESKIWVRASCSSECVPQSSRAAR